MTDEASHAGGGIFPATRWSAIEAARSADLEERRARARPDRRRLLEAGLQVPAGASPPRSADDAQDLTQEFFASLIEPGHARRVRSVAARGCARSCAAASTRSWPTPSATRGGSKRGGGDEPALARVRAGRGRAGAHRACPAPERLDDFFEKEWVRSLFASAVDAAPRRVRGARQAGALRALRALRPRRPRRRRPTYADLARELGIASTDVTNHLAFARREFRRITLELLRETTASEDEFRREARSLLGHAPE